MGKPLPVQLHQDVGRLSSVLPGIRKASRVDQCHRAALVDKRTVGMSKHGDLHSPLFRLRAQPFQGKGHIVIMSVGQKDPVVPQGKLPLFGKPRKEIIVAGNDLRRAACNLTNVILAALRVAQMDQKVNISDFSQNLTQISVLSMGITHHQDSHLMSPSFSFSMVFIARRALPLWLISFFSSAESCAVVSPRSGR